MNMKVKGIPILIGVLGTLMLDKGTGGLGKTKSNAHHPNDSIIKIDPNTKKIPGNLKGLAVTQIPVGNRKLTLVWKTLKWAK